MGQDREDKRKPNQNDDDVGYGKPPKKHRFKKGKSGNPKGRPKGAKGLKTDLKEELASVITVSVGGKEYTGTKQRLALKALSMRASVGNLRAIAQLVNLVVNVMGIEDEDIQAGRLSKRDQELLDQFLGYAVDEDGDGATDNA